MDVAVNELVQLLINTAEKGANVARIIRSQADLLHLLVEEKTGLQKNQRFVQDFKTLADVLVQEIVRHDLSEQIPDLKDNIFGEESNTFTNALGDSITVEILSTQSETSARLCSVLDGNQRAAELLAEVAHQVVTVNPGPNISRLNGTLIKSDDIGVWIDPIDSTAQYISGINGKKDETGIVTEGLQCVAVLIGVYNKSTGLPTIGVTNQPFSQKDPKSNRWTSHTQWGVSYNGLNVNSLDERSPTDNNNAVIMSSSESHDIQNLFEKRFSLHYAAGAGYKILCVIQGLVDAYILSKSTTYKWDACGPHAILLSLGGGLVSYKSLQDLDDITLDQLSKHQVHYEKSDIPESCGAEKWCNYGGIVAYRSQKVVDEVRNIAKESKPISV